MRYRNGQVDGVVVIELDHYVDNRGGFARTFCADEFKKMGLIHSFVQTNSSFTTHRGTMRGLHYQVDPCAEVKLVKCTKGKILDIVVDVRVSSSTFLKYDLIELSCINRRQVYVPSGCAHGFLTLTDDVEVEYPVSEVYAPLLERGVRYDDPAICLQLPIEVSFISEKDLNWPLL